MRSEAKTPDEYYAALPPERGPAMRQLRAVIAENIPEGFVEMMQYGMPGWAVPHSLYPLGYHCDPKLALSFIGLASQKQYISFYHMGLYAESELLSWFTAKWATVSKKKLDMGKCCVRFKKTDDIPYGLIGELCQRMTPADWIAIYELSDPRKKK